ncbi:MAG TPA: S9 family peptidase [Blastocatellia bacterium]|nr:S9 family peptidase [Blastocatellia bacterium]HMX29819.1 S9 family peptidase [Blastocatellia bacterium]HMY74320.1 S9 family peptidase [Blastocatellia bacterium]HMZ20513.1 S9 family peptidase [Blastocatellia bacterium]HNG31180.1 S9 family peptidase [Blastocatellia bacterium]
MKLKIAIWPAAALLLSAVVLNGRKMTAQEQPPKPPIAKKIPKTTQIHGYTETDDYAWLADKTKTDKDVLAYLKAEDDYAKAMMKPTEGFQESLYKEMLARIKETDENVPYKNGAYFYYSRTEQGKQYPIYCRKKGSLTAPEEVTIDMNEMAKGHDYFSIGAYDISEDGHLLAFSTDTTGFRQYNLFVKDLRTGKISDKLAERVVSVSWANDNKTLVYTQEDATTKRPHKVFRTALGSGKDELLYEEKDELYRVYSGKTRSKGYIVLYVASSTTSEMRYLSADQPNGELKLVLPRKEGHEYYLDHIGQTFYIRTNDKGKTFRLVTAPVSDPQVANWKEIIPYRKEVMLEDVDCYADHFVAIERENGLTKFNFHDLKSGKSHYLEFPEPVYVASVGQNAEFETTTFRFNYESFITPGSVFDYDVKTRQRELKKQQPVLGGYEPKLYESKRIQATAADGTKVFISLVYKKDLKLDGKRPLLLEGYGSYGIPNDVDFSSNRLSLLNRGVVYATAHIRGGGDLGKEWHDQGKMMVKKNTFTDFIACAEHLVKEKYTSSDRLVITGGSAGGLLMGAVTNMRPDLFKAVVSYVPFVDVMNTMLDATLPLTVGEYLEWGNPNEKAAYDYMRSYSPYENIEKKAYPTMLVRTSLNDSQVMYWEPAKYVARLRSLKTDSNLLLFKIKLEPGGHGGASGRYDRLKDTAFDYAFMLGQFGITK